MNGFQEFKTVTADGIRPSTQDEIEHIKTLSHGPITESTVLRLSIAEEAAAFEIARAQNFFAAYAAEARKPHCSLNQRDWMLSLLLRAEEAGLSNRRTHERPFR